MAPMAPRVNTQSLAATATYPAPKRNALPAVTDSVSFIHFGGGASSSRPPSSSLAALVRKRTATTSSTAETNKPGPSSPSPATPASANTRPNNTPCASRVAVMPPTHAAAVPTDARRSSTVSVIWTGTRALTTISGTSVPQRPSVMPSTGLGVRGVPPQALSPPGRRLRTAREPSTVPSPTAMPTSDPTMTSPG